MSTLTSLIEQTISRLQHNHGADELSGPVITEALKQAHALSAATSASPDFVRKTNEEFKAWCEVFYTPEFNAEGNNAHGLWAWQEQERRKDQFELAGWLDQHGDFIYRQDRWGIRQDKVPLGHTMFWDGGADKVPEAWTPVYKKKKDTP
jgi:hypothetical protein